MMAARKGTLVTAEVREVVIPTYEPEEPDKNPMFLEKRVYQGSSGRVYPLPFTDRISTELRKRKWTAIFIENEWLEVMVLPEIGGRIHAILDKTTGYDLIYRQNAIKPALVGLAGSWISGGIEFNWPQHHRPTTFMPVDFSIEDGEEGSKTVWLGDHEPMERMKGMHGVCLHPDRAVVELKVRVYNRTPFTQTFLWWANAATRVHEGYQSFFPPDVRFVADHARRAISKFPLCDGKYYGVDYAARAKNGVSASERPGKFSPPHCQPAADSAIPDYRPNDLSWYANIPVPTSYMCVDSNGDFFGGYDHIAGAGIVHVADHRIAPGKKQWTWGNHEFGYAWDRNLSCDEAPYIELMAGVFTDNQPDFSFLAPYETRSWCQYWYGISMIGVPQCANENAAISVIIEKNEVKVGVAVTANYFGASIRLGSKGFESKQVADLAPQKPFLLTLPKPDDLHPSSIFLQVLDSEGDEIIRYAPGEAVEQKEPKPATEPPPPEDVGSSDELYLAGLHLEQYRHATRDPERYWSEALRRDPGDVRCNNALGLRHLRRGEFAVAEGFFRAAIARLTERNPNPIDGEPFYSLGLCLRFQAYGQKSFGGKLAAAYDAFYKAAWNPATASAAFLAIAEIDCVRRDWSRAAEHIERCLELNGQNSAALHLRALVLRAMSREKGSDRVLEDLLKRDPLDHAARYLLGNQIFADGQTRLDIAHDMARAGFFSEAVEILKQDAEPVRVDPRNLGVRPLIGYMLGWLYHRMGHVKAADRAFMNAAKIAADHCFPNRLEEIAVFEAAMAYDPSDAKAAYYLGCFYYDRRRYSDAIRLWERSVKLDPDHSTAWRNLGLAYHNVMRAPKKALAAYEKAFAANRADARLLYERDQLWKRMGFLPKKRLAELKSYATLVEKRDDLSVELCGLYCLTGDHAASMELVSRRNFQPWEGGEGQTLEIHVQTNLSIGKQALGEGNFTEAFDHFHSALASPVNLGEAKHLLANDADVYYWLGEAAVKLGRAEDAAAFWRRSAEKQSDFQLMSVVNFSEKTFYSALSLRRSGHKKAARQLFQDLQKYAVKLAESEAKIDYFATSLPTMLLFNEDLDITNKKKAMFLEAQACFGLGKRKKAERLIEQLLDIEPNNMIAVDFQKTFLNGDYA